MYRYSESKQTGGSDLQFYENYLINIIENMKECLKYSRETYYNDGEYPHRARYFCYAMDYIINQISIDNKDPKFIRKEFADYADICYTSILNNNHHWKYNCEINDCSDNQVFESN